MKSTLKFLGIAFSTAAIIVSIVLAIDQVRYHQILGDWGRKFGYNSFAVEHYSMAIHSNYNNPGAFNSRGVARYNQQQFEEAIKDYDRAIELDPQYTLAIKNRAIAFLWLGKADEAKRDYALACKLGHCFDPVQYCPQLKVACNMGNCIGFQSAIKAGLCPAE